MLAQIPFCEKEKYLSTGEISTVRSDGRRELRTLAHIWREENSAPSPKSRVPASHPPNSF